MVRTLAISACNMSRIERGVFAGAPSPYQVENSYPGTPLSLIVGTSGATFARLLVVTPSTRSAPVFMCVRIGGRLPKHIFTSPLMVAKQRGPGAAIRDVNEVDLG